MSRTRLSTPAAQDDTTQISGWVFADLLLTLAIIFLVSISFSVPERVGVGSNKNNASSSQGRFEIPTSLEDTPNNQGVNFYYASFDREVLLSDLREYFSRENLNPSSEVIYAQVVGGFDAQSEGSELGTFRALEFSIELKKANVTAFAKANFDLTTSSQLGPDQVALRLSFVPPLELQK